MSSKRKFRQAARRVCKGAATQSELPQSEDLKGQGWLIEKTFAKLERACLDKADKTIILRLEVALLPVKKILCCFWIICLARAN